MTLVQVPGFESYAVDENGDIYRTKYNDEGNKAKRHLPHKLVPSLDKNGYKRVILSEHNHLHYVRSNRIVAMTLIPNPNHYPVVNHINGDKSDNRPGNLEWTTWKGNVLHAHKTGLHKGCRTAVTLKNEDETLVFDTITEAAKFLGHDKSCFCRHLTFDTHHGYIDGWDFELKGGKTRKKGGGKR